MRGNDLIERYRRWRDRSDWLKFQRNSCVVERMESTDCRFAIRTSFFGVKVAKRGNDVYQSKVRRRFSEIVESLKTPDVFRVFSKRIGEARAFFVTLTWDVGYCDPDEAWRNDSEFSVSRFYNRWMTGLRRKFGKVDAVRVWDSGQRGYPHPHVLVVLPGHWLPVFLHKGEDGKNRWRLDDAQRDLIRGNWPFYVDVYCASSVSHALSYMSKRAGLGTAYGDPESHGDRTLALTWAFRKRGYGISGDLITRHRNSNRAISQSSGDIWQFLGVFSHSDLGLWAQGRPYSTELTRLAESEGGPGDG